jgi:exopolyphosphatase / guanosine-5'-triphosphate,3'-diphosphate pyrophosphatase
MKQAVIDLGTNTFHLMIVEKNPDGTYLTLFRESRPAKIGRSAAVGAAAQAGVFRSASLPTKLLPAPWAC